VVVPSGGATVAATDFGSFFKFPDREKKVPGTIYMVFWRICGILIGEDEEEDFMIDTIKTAFAAAVFSLFIGCASQPLTQTVINDIGMEDIDRFQFYISTRVALVAVEKVREPNIDKKGTASIRETSFRDIIIINKNTMGVLMDQRKDDEGLLVLEICFEEKAQNSDMRLIFRPDGPGLERHFYLLLNDLRKRVVQYGGRDYSIDTRTGERVYLKIKVDKSLIEKERIRRVKGRKVMN
jgi:hypothetical protein